MYEPEWDSSVRRFRLSESFIDNYRDWKKQAGGRFYGYMDSIAAGSYSDDTQLMLAVYRSIDGDGRGGAALSIKSITGAPIKFIGLLLFFILFYLYLRFL